MLTVLFSMRLPILTGHNSYPHTIELGDFNNDSRLDIAVSNMMSDTIGIFLGLRHVKISQVQPAKPVGDSSQPVNIAVGDFNHDTCLDVVVADRRNNKIIIIHGSGYGTFLSEDTYSTGNNSNPSWVVVSDFNQDRCLDIAVINSGTNNIGVFLGYENGNFSSIVTSSTGDLSSPVSLYVGHFDIDTNLDITVATYGK